MRYLRRKRIFAFILREKKFNHDLLQKTKKFLHWMILYVLPEVYEAMGCVTVECINVSNMNLFVSNYGKSMHLLEFESQQQQETATTIKYLKETWLERITQSVKLCLRDIGKGWFDLGQKNHDIYDVMKLKRFMDLIVQRMQVPYLIACNTIVLALMCIKSIII